MMQRTKKGLKPWHKGTHLRVLSSSYQMNTNMTGFNYMGLKKYLRTFALEESSLSIRRVKVQTLRGI